MAFTNISTERLTLRDLDLRDAQTIFAYRSHPDVSRFQSWGSESADEVRSFIEGLSGVEPGTPGSWYQIGITLQSSGELIGDCGFRLLEAQPLQAEFGIALAPEFQGQGYATEALRALLDYLLVAMGIHRVLGSVDPRNIRSIKLMQNAGLRREAHFVKSLWFKGEWVDDVIFAILAGDWKSNDSIRKSTQAKLFGPRP